MSPTEPGSQPEPVAGVEEPTDEEPTDEGTSASAPAQAPSDGEPAGDSALRDESSGDADPAGGGIADLRPDRLPSAKSLARRAASAVPRTPTGDLRGRAGVADAAFRGVTVTAGAIILLIMVAIAAFLISKAIPAISADRVNFLTTRTWDPDATSGDGARFGIAALAYGTLMTSVIALVVAVPIAVGVALFLTQYVQRVRLFGRSFSIGWLAQTLGYVIDLLAAVPSVVYGLWGLFFLNYPLITASRFLANHFSFIPLFASSNGAFGQSIFVASILLAVMILPIITAISREVFLQTPRDQQEAAYALGATKWEMIRTTVLPYSRSGVVSAAVLGLGRALGETIAVALVLSSNFTITAHILDPGGNTIAANIANFFADAEDTGRGALIASGLVLFAITLLVNFAARAITRKARAGVVL